MLAYSTVSQIGYMFLAVGLGPAGYVAGLAHLLAHGFFKAGLFLGAGSVMHAMNDQVDMRRYGGLWKKLPITFATFGLGYLALIGFPFLSGYFTKDAIIEATSTVATPGAGSSAASRILGAGLTAFYMTRLMLMTFFGRPRWEEGVHPHESPPVMTVPMIVLAVGSVFSGFLLVSIFPLPTGWSRCSASPRRPSTYRAADHRHRVTAGHRCSACSSPGCSSAAARCRSPRRSGSRR